MNTRHFTKKGLTTSALAVALFTFLGFCILTNSTGEYRKYLDTDIPFVYQLNNTTPLEYFASIVAGHMQWNNVPSAYWLFSQGPLSSATDAVLDTINLVFFDVAGINFPPPTNTIAFSRTFTSDVGGYHAVESDMVWNARDFPPSPTGAPGQQDLQGVIAHEFGHHLGLGHQGSPGSPPGCGPLIPQAVMYGLSSSGDTTNRHLHIHDIGGVSAIYPVWILQGTVTDVPTSQPIKNAQVRYLATNVISIGPVESPIANRWERPGLVFDIEDTDQNGNYGNVILDQIFDVVVDAFGYIADTATISFNPPGGIGQTQTIVHDVALQLAPSANITGVVRDANTLAPISATLEFYGIEDTAGLTVSVQTQPNGSYTANLPSTELYNITVIPSSPYVDHVELDSVLLPPSGASVDFDLLEAQVLLVDDDAGDPYEASYQGSLDRLNIRRRTFSVADSAATPAGVLATFTEKPVLLWFTGNDTTDALETDQRLVIIDHLTGGGDAIITGQDIAEFSAPGDSLIAKYLGIQQNGNYLTGALIVRGFPGDIIGNGITFQLVGGAGNQTSKDILSIIGGSVGTPTKTLYYGATDTTNIAAVRVLGPGAFWGVSYFGFGLEVFNEARMDTMILRSMRYFDFVVGVSEPSAGTLPGEFSLAQNYPNPFNPTTQIQYGLPQQSRVSIIVYDVNGRVVTNLFQGNQEAGLHVVHWNGKNSQGSSVSTGIYFYELEAIGTNGNSFVQTKKMLLIK